MNKFIATASLLIVALGIAQGYPSFGPPAGVIGGPFGGPYGGPLGGGPFGGPFGPAFSPRQLAAFPGEKVCAKTRDTLEQLVVDACLPEDLRQRARQLQVANDQGCTGCDTLLDGTDPTVLKQYWKCQALHKKTNDTAVKALQSEAKPFQKACVGAGSAA